MNISLIIVIVTLVVTVLAAVFEELSYKHKRFHIVAEILFTMLYCLIIANLLTLTLS